MARTYPTYKSTRGGDKGLSFQEAVFEGLAQDGGLFVPDFVPNVSSTFKNWSKLSFADLAFEITSHYIPESDVPSGDLKEMMKKNYAVFDHPEVVPTKKVGDLQIMEIFHGPTLAFKDVALQGLGNLYEYFLKKNPRRLTILCATSGDTGSAAIHGIRGKANVDCFVLFPEGRVSAVQQLQMTSVLDPNIHCCAVKGTFDDCQNIVKELMGDLTIKKKFGLGAVNSINWARILLQVTYYFYSYYKLFPNCDGTITFSVPTGNFGDVLAGYYAKRMGLPIKQLVVATNSNDILHRFFTTGKYDKETVAQTSSPSMDIGISSNFERYLFYLYGEDTAALNEAMKGFKTTGLLHVSEELRQKASLDFVSACAKEDQVSETLNEYISKHDYNLCPHTACGVSAVKQLRTKMNWKFGGDHEVVVLATAHPAKFRDAVLKATGKEPPLTPALQRMQGAKTRFQTLPARAEAVEAMMQRALYCRGTFLHYADRPPPERCESLPGEPGTWLVALDVEGTLVGEAWLELQKRTQLEELKLTTAHEPDYDKLMMYRIDVLRRNGIKLEDMKDVVRSMDPLEGCIEFLAWLKTIVPRILLLTDTFEEYAMPLFDKLGYPSVFCNSLTINESGEITGHLLRLRDQKRRAVESFQRLNFRVISIGDSFNDISMMKQAERGILMNPSEKVVAAHKGEFPVCTDYGALRDRILDIVMKPPMILPKPLTLPTPLDYESIHRRMWLVVSNVSGTLAPDAWLALNAMTGIDQFSITSRDVPDFDSLMELRAKTLREHGIKLADVFDKMKAITPLPGALDFLKWLKPMVPRSFMISDSFEEYCLPVFEKLGHPMCFCNFLEADEDGYLARHVWRVRDQKRLAVEEFQRLNFRVIAIGGSFNDIAMLKSADAGIIFKPSEHITTAHPEIPAAADYSELKALITDIVCGNSKKRKADDL